MHTLIEDEGDLLEISKTASRDKEHPDCQPTPLSLRVALHENVNGAQIAPDSPVRSSHPAQLTHIVRPYSPPNLIERYDDHSQLSLSHPLRRYTGKDKDNLPEDMSFGDLGWFRLQSFDICQTAVVGCLRKFRLGWVICNGTNPEVGVAGK